MPTDKATLLALRERVAAVTDGAWSIPNMALARDIAAALDDPWSGDEEGQFGGYGIMPARVRYPSSIDAALGLMERKLVLWNYDIEMHYRKYMDDDPPDCWASLYRVYPKDSDLPDSPDMSRGVAPTAPLAILLALFDALLAQPEAGT